MDTEELICRFELSKSSEYAEIRKRVVDYIIQNSSSTLPDDVIRGMLMVLKYVDGWVDEYMKALAKRKEK